MKNFTLRTAAAVLAFLAGVAAWAVCYAYLSQPVEVPPPVIPERRIANGCFPGMSTPARHAVYDEASYFPRGAFAREPRMESFAVEWYSEHLAAMGEPRLLSQPGGPEEGYRFLWLRSFHNPVSVRLWRAGETYLVNVKRTSGAGGYGPGKLVVNHTRILSDAEWDGFATRLNRACFWEMPPNDDMMGGTDGAQWILEGTREGRYHVVDRWSPDRGAFREACLYLVDALGLGVETSRDNIY